MSLRDDTRAVNSVSSNGHGHYGSPFERVLARLEAKGYDPKELGSGKAESRCPAHEGSRRNLSIGEGADGAVLIKCHHEPACSVDAIVSALGLEKKDLFRPLLGSKPKAKTTKKPGSFNSAASAGKWIATKDGSKLAGTWFYHDTDGKPYAAVLRLDHPEAGKTYRPVWRDSGTGLWGIGDPPQWLPYHSDRLNGAPSVWFFEGEKCVELAAGLDLIATTTAHGAKSPHKTDLTCLAGKTVYLVPDHDPEGERYVEAVSGLLWNLSPRPTVKVVRLPGLTSKGDDLAEWIEAREGKAPGVIRTKLLRLAAAAPVWSPPPAFKTTKPSPRFHLTDLGNAKRLVSRFGDRIRYCKSLGAWFVWDGSIWKEDASGAIYRLAKTVPEIILEEPSEDDDDAKAQRQWSHNSEDLKRINATIALTWSEPGIPVNADDLNGDPMLLCVKNGTVDLRAGTLRPHRQADLITKMAPVDYDPTAECPRFLAFLDRIMGGNQNLVGYLQRAIGYAITGDVSEHALFFFYGTGRNGKGTLLELFLALLGDYATTVDASLITAKRNDDHPTGLTDLDGCRFVPTVEVEDGKHLAEALVKKLTGGDRIKARRMRQDFYEFMPTHKIFLAANHPPEIRGLDEGIWSRVKLIPFSVFIPPEERVKDLREMLVREEGPGILAWAVQGCLEWQRNGLQEPPEVMKATENYRTDMDTIAGFLAERCDTFLEHETLKTNARESKDALYKAYTIWANANGCESVLSSRKFGGEMQRRGYPLKESNGRCYRLGVTLKSVSEDSEETREMPETGIF